MIQLRKWYGRNRLGKRTREKQRERVLRKFANMRAAKERKRMERLENEISLADGTVGTTAKTRRAKPLFVITVRCRDGGVVKLPIHETPWGTLSVSATDAGKRIACLIGNYRPASDHIARAGQQPC